MQNRIDPASATATATVAVRGLDWGFVLLPTTMLICGWRGWWRPWKPRWKDLRMALLLSSSDLGSWIWRRGLQESEMADWSLDSFCFSGYENRIGRAIRPHFARIHHCNASNFGLQACVFTEDINKAILISDAMETGTVQFNSAPARGPDHFPFQWVLGHPRFAETGRGHEDTDMTWIGKLHF
ncbi:hypothetical protein Dimus_019418 [Dionaea muscipula]